MKNCTQFTYKNRIISLWLFSQQSAISSGSCFEIESDFIAKKKLVVLSGEKSVRARNKNYSFFFQFSTRKDNKRKTKKSFGNSEIKEKRDFDFEENNLSYTSFFIYKICRKNRIEKCRK